MERVLPPRPRPCSACPLPDILSLSQLEGQKNAVSHLPGQSGSLTGNGYRGAADSESGERWPPVPKVVDPRIHYLKVRDGGIHHLR
jgi:hypothetical protein